MHVAVGRVVVFSLLLAGCEPIAVGPSIDGGPHPDAPSVGPSTGPGGSPGSIAPRPGVSGEICGNGVDDDNDHQADEDCACTVGATQGCWIGQRIHRGVGDCHDGTQTCADLGGGRTGWGECRGSVVPANEVAGDGRDQDCNGADAPASCPNRAEFENCTNGIDDDCDGLLDGHDYEDGCSSCNPAGFTVGRLCKGRDFDCGGPIACTDMACRGGNEIDCRDGFDNDCDGQVDCADVDCAVLGLCGAPPGSPGTPDTGPPPGPPDAGAPDASGPPDASTSWWPFGDASTPSDGGSSWWPFGDAGSWWPFPPATDAGTSTEPGPEPSEDAFGLCQCVPGLERWCDTPTGCLWGIQQCTPGGRWGRCRETEYVPADFCAYDYYYNRDCCVAAGACCQNYPDFTNGSVGNCEGAINCDGRL